MKYIILSNSDFWVNHQVSKIENLNKKHPIVSSGNYKGIQFSLIEGIETSQILNKIFNKEHRRFYKLKIIE